MFVSRISIQLGRFPTPVCGYLSDSEIDVGASLGIQITLPGKVFAVIGQLGIAERVFTF